MYWLLFDALIFQKEVNATNYAMSADQNFILLESNYSKVIFF